MDKLHIQIQQAGQNEYRVDVGDAYADKLTTGEALEVVAAALYKGRSGVPPYVRTHEQHQSREARLKRYTRFVVNDPERSQMWWVVDGNADCKLAGPYYTKAHAEWVLANCDL